MPPVHTQFIGARAATQPFSPCRSSGCAYPSDPHVNWPSFGFVFCSRLVESGALVLDFKDAHTLFHFQRASRKGERTTYKQRHTKPMTPKIKKTHASMPSMPFIALLAGDPHCISKPHTHSKPFRAPELHDFH